MNETDHEVLDPKIVFQKAKERALRLLARRDHSAVELRNKLKQKIKITDQLWDQVHSFLKELGYMVAEDELANRWIKQWREEGRGRRWMVGKLRTKGLTAPDLRDDEEELEAARLFLEKKSRGADLASLNLQTRAKMNRALMSRGFSGTVISSLLRPRK